MSDPNNPSTVNYADYSLAEERRRPLSVIVLSIIGILWAALALICVPMSFLQFMIPMPPPQDAITADTRADPLLFGATIIGNGLMFFLGLLLLIGSIGSLMLKRFGWMAMIWTRWALS